MKHPDELFRLIAETAADATVVIDYEGKIIFWNKAVGKLFGYSANEVTQKDLTVLMPERFRQTHKKALKRIAVSSQPWQARKIIELSGLRRDGTEFPLELSLSTFKKGDEVYFTGLIHDITERRRAEEALWSSQEYSQNIVNSSLDMIIAVDNRRRITAFNAAAAETFGYESEEVFGKHVNLLYANPKEGLAVHKKTIGKGHHVQEILNRRKNGALFPSLLSASVLRDAHGNRVGVMGVSRDITDRKRAEEQLQQYAAELERSNRDLRQFAHAISHDLQEPLRTMSSYVQLLAERYRRQLDTKADDYIGHVVDGANRMREMIRGILALSKVSSETKELEPTDCEDVLKSVQAGLRVFIKETHAQITHDPLPTVMAESTQIGQLFQNLIENAIKFRGKEPACVHISAREERDHWLFSIRDNGMGIEPEQAERIFEIFQRLVPREEYPGTGIGLSICRKIVERHGGKIWVKPTPGEGSTFYFTIER